MYIYRKFASKHLTNLLSSLGFSCTYYEAARLEASFILGASEKEMKTGCAFGLFIFDNADFNVNILDGLGTFHAM